MLKGAILAFIGEYEEAVQCFRECIKLREANLKEATIEN
jgi:hypothetical protein